MRIVVRSNVTPDASFEVDPLGRSQPGPAAEGGVTGLVLGVLRPELVVEGVPVAPWGRPGPYGAAVALALVAFAAWGAWRLLTR